LYGSQLLNSVVSAIAVWCNRDQHCVNERYLFIALSSCFFAITRLVSLLQPGYFQLTFPSVKVCRCNFTLVLISLSLVLMCDTNFTIAELAFYCLSPVTLFSVILLLV